MNITILQRQAQDHVVAYPIAEEHFRSVRARWQSGAAGVYPYFEYLALSNDRLARFAERC
jgi:hypothetical protein